MRGGVGDEGERQRGVGQFAGLRELPPVEGTPRGHFRVVRRVKDQRGERRNRTNRRPLNVPLAALQYLKSAPQNTALCLRRTTWIEVPCKSNFKKSKDSHV